MKWEQIAARLVKDLEGKTDEAAIAGLCQAVMGQLSSQYDKISSRKKPLATIRKAVTERYPQTSEQQGQWQYSTTSGKRQKDSDGNYIDNPSRWEHLALKHLTFSQDDWDSLKQETQVQTDSQPIPQPQTQTIADMNISFLELDAETQQIAEKAIAQSGMSLADFIRQSVRVYAKTITGKTKQLSEGLATVSTWKLLNDKAFSTHPGRAEELTRRAIQAIKLHNSNATEDDQRWCITQTAICELTGSRASSVKEILQTYAGDIDDHNETYGLNPYSNRKGRDRDIRREIDIAALVPDGVDD